MTFNNNGLGHQGTLVRKCAWFSGWPMREAVRTRSRCCSPSSTSHRYRSAGGRATWSSSAVGSPRMEGPAGVSEPGGSGGQGEAEGKAPFEKWGRWMLL